ncbi:hypothetical protein VIBNISO65_1040013 [Vibrio nigripulchritudo SO65]|nr:hypothetical protein VIBNIAM115_1150019 [Vibrio nigripulchritudo AM115]CCN42779.1 hypothetical protein VIBNIFTn2_390029 [Vibrio nigripulchritudo FTn2]CCN67505.1 hypothetical protein VIBNIPon4_80013 [Vibrio nigripulchritudo POn4]CCN74204.1 hypothetical protein VIBNISO65_1040013 [Vibrio nigripulchritudo SO65]
MMTPRRFEILGERSYPGKIFSDHAIMGMKYQNTMKAWFSLRLTNTQKTKALIWLKNANHILAGMLTLFYSLGCALFYVIAVNTFHHFDAVFFPPA